MSAGGSPYEAKAFLVLAKNSDRVLQEKKDTDEPIFEYRIALNKKSYSQGEDIKFNLQVTNTSIYQQAIWIDGGSYPVGNGLELYDENKVSQIENCYAHLVSRALYSSEEVELLKTRLQPQEKFSKTYTLSQVVRFTNRPLKPGNYALIYKANEHHSNTCYFEIITP